MSGKYILFTTKKLGSVESFKERQKKALANSKKDEAVSVLLGKERALNIAKEHSCEVYECRCVEMVGKTTAMITKTTLGEVVWTPS